jgi:lipid-A-disaccharide synthase
MTENTRPQAVTRIFILAGEASGDAYAGAVAKHLQEMSKAEDRSFELHGWGGEALEAAGCKVTKHYRELAFMGFWEVIRNLKTIRANLRACERELVAFKPDVVLSVDFPSFVMRVAAWAKNRGRSELPTHLKWAHFISPQVWAWRKGRVAKIAWIFDRLFTVLPFEAKLFRGTGLDVEFVGHPLLDLVSVDGPMTEDSARFAAHGVRSDRPIIAFLPGSRNQELQRMLPLAGPIAEAFPDHQLVIAGAPGQTPASYASLPKDIPVLFGETRSLMRLAVAGVVTSGTATLEAALIGMPQVIAYRTSPLTYGIARLLARVDHIGLPNILLERTLVPERIQLEATAEQLTADLHDLLTGSEAAAQRVGYAEIRGLLGESGATRRVAKSIASW